MEQSLLLTPSRVDELVEAFEQAREIDGTAQLSEFLPAADDPHFAEVAIELIRVDMEYSWRGPARRTVPDYQRLFPEVLRDPTARAQIAYEEYRLRVQAGDAMAPEQFGRRDGVDVARWPRLDAAAQTADAEALDASQPRSIVQAAWNDAATLAEDVANFPPLDSQFAGFQLDAILGQGAFARVYRARQSALSNRVVVLKAAAGQSLEPQHLARLQHTNIVPIYSVHRADGLTAVCMPYLGKHTLADVLQSITAALPGQAAEQNLISTFLQTQDATVVPGTTRPNRDRAISSLHTAGVVQPVAEASYVDAVAWIVMQLAEGLAHAHQRGIIHRDLKPANILVTDEGVPMVLDFNLSETAVVHGPKSLTVGGTLPYMSPEQLRALTTGRRLTPATDIYSLGVVFFELLAGQRPFPDHRGPLDDVLADAMAARHATAPSVRMHNPTVPPSVAAAVERCLAHDLANRYAAMDELAEDLGRHLRHLPLRHAPNRSIVERGRKWVRRHPRISSGGGVATIAATILIALLAAFFVRGQHLARRDAEATFHAFMQDKPSVYMGLALGVTRSESQILADGLAHASSSLEPYGILDNANWEDELSYRSLPAATQRELNQRLTEVLYLMARARAELARLETDPQKRDAALAQAARLNRAARSVPGVGRQSRALAAQQASFARGTDVEQTSLPATADLGPFSTGSVLDQYAEACRLLDARDYQAAAPRVALLRDHAPSDPAPWLLLGDCYAALGQLQRAEGCFSTAVALQSDSYVGYFHRGLCRIELQWHDAAWEDFNRVIELRPALSGGYLNRAIVRRNLGNHAGAIADLDRALALGATQTRIYFLRSQIKRQLNDLAGAKKDLLKGLSLTPSDELSWVARGVARMKTDPEAALADFRHALKLNPQSTPALQNCVHLLGDRLNRPAEAMTALNQLLSINPRDAGALAGRAVLRARDGKRDQALADVRQLLQLSKEPRSLFQAACALSHTSMHHAEDATRGMTLLSRAVLADPRWLARAETDPDLENLRAAPQYESLVAQARSLHDMIMRIDPAPQRE